MDTRQRRQGKERKKNDERIVKEDGKETIKKEKKEAKVKRRIDTQVR